MAHAQKPEFVFPRNGRVHLNRWGRQFSRLLAVEECGSVVVMVVMLDRTRSEVKWNCTGYPLHSPVSPSLPLSCVTVCHQVPNELYDSIQKGGFHIPSFFCGRHEPSQSLPVQTPSLPLKHKFRHFMMKHPYWTVVSLWSCVAIRYAGRILIGSCIALPHTDTNTYKQSSI